MSCTPLLSIWLDTRVPTVAGAVVLIAFIVINVFGFFFWVPAASALVASAIAGPPRRRGTVQQSSA